MNTILDDLRAAAFSVWNRRWIALGVAWGLCMLGWLGLALIPNSYESRARIFVQLDDALTQQIGMTGDRKRDIDRVRNTLTSAVNLEKVIRSTRLGDEVDSPKELEIAVLDLAKNVKVVSQEDNLFEITATAGNRSLSDTENAKLAQAVAQKMIDIFREENISGAHGEMTGTIEFMNQQLANRQKELEAAEQKRLEFEARNPELAQGTMSVMQRLEAQRAELRSIDADLAAAQSSLAAISAQLAGTPATLAVAGSAGGARGMLAQAQADLSAMRARGLTDNHPDVIAQKNQIAALRAQAAGEGNTGPSGQPNPAYSSLQSIKAEKAANVQALQTRRASIQTELSNITSKQISNPQVAAEQARINRDYDVLKQQYDKLLQDREELRLRGQVETEHNSVQFEVIDPPTTPRAPVAPNRPILLALILFAGIGAGLGAAFAVSQLRSTFATTTKLEEALGLPVLGAITQTVNEAGKALRRKRMRQFAAACGGLGGLFIMLLVIEFIQRRMVA